METRTPSDTDHGNIEAALSLERFGRYLGWADGDRDRALELYALNMRVSEALYTPLQMLEVALRNRIHGTLVQSRGERWFDAEGFLQVAIQKDQVAKAVAELLADNKAPLPGRVVAALTFSFWTSMLSPVYENLWQTDLHRIARRENGKGLRRKDLSGPLTPIRVLRNRIAHHEPILAWNLPKHHANIVQITHWLSPAAASWAQTFDRFDAVHPEARVQLARDASQDD